MMKSPPSFEEIFAANNKITGALGVLLQKGMSVSFVEGNHDMHLTQEDLDKAFGKFDNLNYAENYHDNGVYAAHGHSFDPFNERTQDPKALYNFPLGYFISRIVATKQATENSDKKPIIEIVEGAIKAGLGDGSVAIAVFDALLKDAGMGDNPAFIMADGNEVMASDVRTAYRDTRTALSIADLKPKAEYLSRDRDDIKVVIFGHSHDKVLDPLDPENPADPAGVFDYTKVYANCGTWSADKAPTYVEVEPDENPSKSDQVRMMEWKNGAPHRLDTNFFTP